MGLMTAGFFTFHARDLNGAASRMAACTLSSGVSFTWGVSGVVEWQCAGMGEFS
jgi:NADH:ubiquinone oxidoreductase subunit 4 (subunit M)